MLHQDSPTIVYRTSFTRPEEDRKELCKDADLFTNETNSTKTNASSTDKPLTLKPSNNDLMSLPIVDDDTTRKYYKELKNSLYSMFSWFFACSLNERLYLNQEAGGLL